MIGLGARARARVAGHGRVRLPRRPRRAVVVLVAGLYVRGLSGQFARLGCLFGLMRRHGCDESTAQRITQDDVWEGMTEAMLIDARAAGEQGSLNLKSTSLGSRFPSQHSVSVVLDSRSDNVYHLQRKEVPVLINCRLLDNATLVAGDKMDLSGALDLGDSRELEVVVTVITAASGVNPILELRHAACNSEDAYLDFETRVQVDLSATGKSWFHVSHFTRWIAWFLAGTLESSAVVTIDLVGK